MNYPFSVPVTKEVHYPVSDGLPMGETPAHVWNIGYSLETLDLWFLADPMVFVAGNMFVYYVMGNPKRHFSPDIFVVRGIPKVTIPPRECYLLWENKPIDFILEFTSKSTRDKDLVRNMELYEMLGVFEYFLFDPHDEYLQPCLVGYRLVEGEYAPIEPVDGRIPSEVLGLHVEYDGSWVRFYDPKTKTLLPTPREEHDGRLIAEEERNAAEEQARAELAARLSAESETERLRREVDELRRRLGERNGPESAAQS